MFSHPHLLVMFAEQLSANHVPIFADDPDEPIDIFGVLANQLGEFLQLPFHPFQTPGHIAQGQRGVARGLRHGSAIPPRKSGHYDIALHAHSIYLRCTPDSDP
jgi:hypothetical protein